MTGLVCELIHNVLINGLVMGVILYTAYLRGHSFLTNSPHNRIT